MATFTNVATLTYTGGTATSNTVTGEVLDAVAATKTAAVGTYAPGDTITYVVTLQNTSANALTGLTVTDDLGGYTAGTGTVYPLTYVPGSLLYYVDGVLQAAPTVTAGPPMTITGINIPAGEHAILVYQARVNSYANPATGGTITNTVTVNTTINPAVTASETITAADAADLEIQKAVSPTQVTQNGTLTYTFTLRNYGNAPITAADNATITDTFDPILRDITVTFNGTPWTATTNYTYNTASGLFTTVPGQITVPAATYTQNADGSYTVEPGTATLVVSGIVS